MELKATTWELRGRTGVLTLNRPHRGNAWTGRMDTEVKWLLAEADSNADVRVIVLTGAGERFCVGGDSKALEGHVEKGGYDRGLSGEQPLPGYGVATEFDQAFASHFGLSKPLIAAVNGAAAGVGLALAAFCDIRFADPGAKFTTAHGKLALPAEYGLSWILPRIMGTGRALDMLLTSRVVMAPEAKELGLVNQIFPKDQLLSSAIAYADQLADSVSAGALAATRQQVYLDLHRDAASSVTDSIGRMDAMMREPDYQEGVSALVEGRPPNF